MPKNLAFFSKPTFSPHPHLLGRPNIINGLHLKVGENPFFFDATAKKNIIKSHNILSILKSRIVVEMAKNKALSSNIQVSQKEQRIKQVVSRKSTDSNATSVCPEHYIGTDTTLSKHSAYVVSFKPHHSTVRWIC